MLFVSPVLMKETPPCDADLLWPPLAILSEGDHLEDPSPLPLLHWDPPTAASGPLGSVEVTGSGLVVTPSTSCLRSATSSLDLVLSSELSISVLSSRTVEGGREVKEGTPLPGYRGGSP